MGGGPPPPELPYVLPLSTTLANLSLQNASGSQASIATVSVNSGSDEPRAIIHQTANVPRPTASPSALDLPNPITSNRGVSRPSAADALAYLEMVRTCFHQEPDVYDHFMDIMEDFKSKS